MKNCYPSTNIPFNKMKIMNIDMPMVQSSHITVGNVFDHIINQNITNVYLRHDQRQGTLGQKKQFLREVCHHCKIWQRNFWMVAIFFFFTLRLNIILLIASQWNKKIIQGQVYEETTMQILWISCKRFVMYIFSFKK